MPVRRAAACLVAFVTLTMAGAASAQEKGATGITMGYPASVGIVYHVSDRFAIRPELSLSFSSSSSDNPISLLTSDSSTVGVGASGIFYLHRRDKLGTYISPRYTYARAKATSESTFSPGTSETTLSSHAITGSFGAQYSLHDRFSVFGEVGAGYTGASNRSDISGVRTETHTFSTRTGVGVIFYF